ncbi:MAG: ABC transporter ATP-binding protein [Natronospirillum sp.]
MNAHDNFPTQPLAFCAWIARRFVLGRLLLLAAITVFSTASMSSTPWVVGRLIDALPEAVAQQDAALVSGWFGLLLVAWLVGPALGRLYTFVNAFTLPTLAASVNAMLFQHTLRQSSEFFQNTFTGALTQRIRRASQGGPNLVEYFVLQFAQVFVGILVAGFWIFTAQPFYGWAYVGFTAVFVVVSLLMARRVLHVGRALGSARSRVTGQLADALGAIDVVHSFGGRLYESARLSERLAEEEKRGKEARFWFSGMRVAQLVLTAGFMSVLVAFALQDAVLGIVSIGAVAMLLTIGLQLAMSITNLGDYILDFYLELGEVKEALDVLAKPLPLRAMNPTTPFVASQGAVTLAAVDFTYPGQLPLYQALNLNIRSGEKVGLAGPSGGGKSTLFKLMTGRYSPQHGRIRIDGQDINALAPDVLARQIAEVSQTAELFHRTVRENIRYGRPDASDSEVEAAAQAAQCAGFIAALPQGYDTLVGERGVKLSGGERQRIAIARAVLKDAPILLLDEATSALDSESEHAIQQALTVLMEGRTVIAIAHRLSTLVHMDRILYLENGHVRESGTHAELLARNGNYAGLWRRQIQQTAMAS